MRQGPGFWLFVVVAFALSFLFTSLALARDDGSWINQPQEIRSWFSSLMQPDNPYMSCCGEADAFDVDLVGDGPGGSLIVSINNGKGILPNGTRVTVPRSKLQSKYGNPLDNYVLFVGSSGQVYCLIPKSGV